MPKYDVDVNLVLKDSHSFHFITFAFMQFMHLADAFIQSNLLLWLKLQAKNFFFVSMCVPWELNPQPFALLMQCFTTEPLEHKHFIIYKHFVIFYYRLLQNSQCRIEFVVNNV